MKCAYCGKKMSNGMSVCPHCGQPTDIDEFDNTETGSSSGFSNMDFDEDPVRVIKTRNKNSGKMIPALVTLCLVLAGITAAMFILANRAPQLAPLPVFAAPTGHSERIDEGRGILLNELLIIPEQSISRQQLEKLIEPLGGVPVAYMPEINQYQVRFNTDTQADLDRCRATLDEKEEIFRADYNLLYSVPSQGTHDEVLSIPAGSGEKIGVLGEWIPKEAGLLKTIFLPSLTCRTEEELTAAGYDSDFFSKSWRASVQQLSKGREVTAASAFCYEFQDDGTVYSVTTAAALRCQLASLVKSGLSWIAIPLCGPKWNNDKLLEQESAQMDLLISALENYNHAFMFCISQSGTDWFPRVLTGSEKTNQHTLAVNTCGTADCNVLDLTGMNTPVYTSTGILTYSDFCEVCEDPSNAVLSAAAYMAGKPIPQENMNRAYILSEITSCSEAITADPEGTVRCVYEGSNQNNQFSEDLKAVSLQITDGVTGLPVGNASVEWVPDNQRALTNSEGRILLVTENGQGTVRVSADGYTVQEQLTVSSNTGSVSLMPADWMNRTGTVRFEVQDRDEQAPGGLTVTMKDAESGEIRLVRKTGYTDRLNMYPGTYEMIFTAYNRTTVTVHTVSVTTGEETTLPPVFLSIPSDISGTVSGMIRDAMTGDSLPDVTLSFYDGIGASETGRPAAKITNQGNGQYSVLLPAGEYTMFVSKDGYKTASTTVHSRGEATLDRQNCTITPLVPEGQIRIVLEWGMAPRDLDSHLFNKSQQIHVFFSAKNAQKGGREVVNLDVDDTDGEGPETTTILQQLPGKYAFMIHDYTNRENYNSNAMAASGAKVTVYVGNDNPIVYTVPNQKGIVWEVFTLENGRISSSNRIISESEWNELCR